MKKFVIDRKIWLRGEGAGPSRLLRPDDGKMCCLGIYLNACRVPKKKLYNIGVPSSLNMVPNQAVWLLEDYDDTCGDLINTNDSTYITKKKRESTIKKLFAKQKIKVSFKN